MPPLPCVYDSEDDDSLSGLSPMKDQPAVSSLLAEMDPARESQAAASNEQASGSTGEQLRQAHLDLIAPTPGINMRGTSPPASTRKRRMTANDAVHTPSNSKKAKRTNTALTPTAISSLSLGLESVGSPDELTINPALLMPATGDTIRVTTQELEILQALDKMGQARPLERQPLHQKSVSDLELSSPMPWSAATIDSRSPPTQRKTKPSVATDGVYSDEVAAIGLPKEQYRPRKSRSRSTQVVNNEPIDWSARPEKAIKAKRRTKTVGSVPVDSSHGVSPLVEPLTYEEPPLRKPLHSDTTCVADSTDTTVDSANVGTHNDEATNVPTTIDDTAIQAAAVANAVSAETTPACTHEPRAHPQVQVIIPRAVEAQMPPPKATPKAKKGTKAKRSQTTIFEDHVGLEVPRKSPTLRQQQDARQHILDEADPNVDVVKKATTPTKGKAGKKKKAIKVIEETLEDDVALTSEPIPEKHASQTSNQVTEVAVEEELLQVQTMEAPQGRAVENGTEVSVSLVKLTGKISPSPLKRGASLYRVGLSRTQKIQPLLRIIRQ